MSKKTKKIILMIGVNLVEFVVLLLLIEFGFRWFWTGQPEVPGAIYNQQFQPYIMFSTNSYTGKITWWDQFRQTEIDGEVHFNNYGFSMDEDLDFTKEYEKEDNERVVLITGGSAVHGVGATSNGRMIHEQMEKELNELQDKYEYRVVNLGMGGWIAYQEYIGMNMWGKWMKPDWVVVMDGRNDIAVACAHAQGAANPLYFHQMRSYIDGYLRNQLRPSFYRGWLENELVKYSFAYRSLTGKQYVPQEQYLVESEGFSRVGTKTSWEDIERQIIFYMHAQESMLGLSDKAKYILSLQPLSQTYSETFVKSEEELAKMAIENQGAECGLKLYQTAGVAYFMNKAEIGLKELAEQYSDKRVVKTFNMSLIFPDQYKDRNQFFLDEAHLNDAGQERVGKFYAYQILKEDIPEMEDELEERIRAIQPYDQVFPKYWKYSLVLYEGKYYGLLRPEEVNLANREGLAQCLETSACVIGDTLEEVKQLVNLSTFTVAEENYKGYYIVAYQDKFYILSRALGALEQYLNPEVLENIESLLQECQAERQCAIGNSLEEAKQLVDILINKVKQ